MVRLSTIRCGTGTGRAVPGLSPGTETGRVVPGLSIRGTETGRVLTLDVRQRDGGRDSKRVREGESKRVRERERVSGREGEGGDGEREGANLSLIHISEPTRPRLI
eukprot:1794806-Rhodomonas_salina.1